MGVLDVEVEGVLARAVATRDDELAATALGELAQRRLAAGDAAAALRLLREAAEHAGALGERAHGRVLGELALVLAAVGEAALAARTLDTALAHLARAEDHAGAAALALAHARAVSARGDAGSEAAWATAAARCAAAGRERDELTARIAAARAAKAQGDVGGALRWLAGLAPRLDRCDGADGTWACGELGALWLASGRSADAVPLLARAAREEAAAGRRDAAAMRLHQLQLCLAMLGRASG